MICLVNLVLDKLSPWLYIYLRPFIKWLMHTFTHSCELQRIVYGAQPGAIGTSLVERSLELSKNVEIKKLILELNRRAAHSNAYELLRSPTLAVYVVCNAKNINPKMHPEFPELFGTYVLYIWSYRRLAKRVERMCTTEYDCNKKEHAEKVLHLWINAPWEELGYEDEGPPTDFRGMNSIALENLLYFVREFSETAKKVCLHSRIFNFCYAIVSVSINITALAVRLVKTGVAKTHFYNLAHSSMEPCSLEQFHKFYCYLFIEFDRIWMGTEGRCIMDFGKVFRDFEISILEKLHNDNALLKTNITVESVESKE